MTRVVAGLAFAAVVFATVTLDDGVVQPLVNDLVPATAFLAFALPWLLAAGLFALAWSDRAQSDRAWLPGLVLGLIGGAAGLLAGASGPFQVVALVLAVLVFVRTSAVAAVLGAGAMAVLLVEALALLGQERDLVWAVVFWLVVVVLVGWAGFELRDSRPDAIAPALLLVSAAWAMEPGFYPYNLAFLPLLVVVPLAEILTAGPARLAARLTIGAVLLMRAAEYAYVSSLDFTRVAHVVLTLAAVLAAAGFSRSRKSR
ncbi:hypothetical protein [Lentzea aerocolonigenes]|uniref:hypothetical protein n=1 Tax=Lentzea aerocolonigenes TaxID=68170 RepID=UPI0005ECF18D|nr:hypothetical protein [Lentzea aerocolonigenes]